MSLISLLKRILLIRKQKIFIIQNKKELKKVSPKIKVHITEINFNNLEYLKDFRGEEYINKFKKFLIENQIGIYAWNNNKVIGHAWAFICKEKRCKVNRYIYIKEGEALIHFCNVKEEYRGKNIYPFMLTNLSNFLFTSDRLNKILIDTEKDNISSIKGIEKAGFTFIGTGTYFQILGKLVYTKENKNGSQ